MRAMGKGGLASLVAGICGLPGPLLAQYEPKIPANYDAVLRAQEEADKNLQPGSDGSRKAVPAPAAAPVSAPDQPNQGGRWYAGFGLGGSAFQASIEQAKASVFSTGANTVNVAGHGYDRAAKAYVGYALSGRFSVEAGLWDFGRARYTADVSLPVTTSFDRSFSARGYGIDAVLWQPIGKSFWVFGKAGGMLTTVR